MPATLEIKTRTARYQEGSIARVTRAKGPDVWVYRWRELDNDGNRVQRKRVIGDVDQFPTKSDAKREVDNMRCELNAQDLRAGKMTVGDAWGHFQAHELSDPDVDRSASTISRYLQVFEDNILPTWEDMPLDDVKAVRVEKWLRSLTLANGTKAKIRNSLSSLFSHCIRHELYEKLNPISSVRQSAVRREDPDILTLDEIRAMLPGIGNEAVRTMVAVAATTALRRSEICGLRWKDLDFEKLWMNLRRGVVFNIRTNKPVVQPVDVRPRKARKSHPAITKLKTKASRKGIPMTQEIADLLAHWRTQTPYPEEEAWVFASHEQDGAWPYHPVSAMKYWVRPAAKAAGITKKITWHVFRHSVGSLLGHSGEKLKVVQEILRHASPRITAELYQQADQTQKREALNRFSGLFVVPDTKTA